MQLPNHRWLFLLLFLVTACYFTPVIPGFDTKAWKKSEPCDSVRLMGARHLTENQSHLLGSTQNEIELLLGKAPVNQLADRNEKYFRYPVTRSCGPNQSLQFRFNALGHLKEVTIVYD